MNYHTVLWNWQSINTWCIKQFYQMLHDIKMWPGTTDKSTIKSLSNNQATLSFFNLIRPCNTFFHQFCLQAKNKGKSESSPIALGPELIPVYSQSACRWLSHPPHGRLPLLSARPAVTFPAKERHRPLTGTKLYCLVTETQQGKYHTCNNTGGIMISALDLWY